MRAPAAALAAVLAAPAPVAAQDVRERIPAASVEVAGILDQRLVDTDGDGRRELLLVRAETAGQPAAVLRLGFEPESAALQPRGEIVLRDAAHTVVAFADVLPAPGVEVVVADPRGTACLPWDGDDAPVVLARRARFQVRVDQPQLSPFVADLNQDGELDLLLPGLRGVTPFLHDGRGEDGQPRFRRMQLVPVPVEVEVDPGSRGLDSELVGRVRIPMIRTADLNGDGRPDLLTRDGQTHGFHLQADDGSFRPPIEVDIGQFEDSTPKAAVDLGSTVVIGDRQLLQDGDINGDGIPDWVVAHRRKIWTFVAGRNGPQFTKARTQAVADDVTAMLLADIDNDERADLLTFRVRLPSLGELLVALVRSIDVDIKAVGYRSEADGFARLPKWRRVVTLRVPPILSLLSRQDELIERFTKEIGKARIAARGDLRGGPSADVALATADRAAVEIFADVGDAPAMTSSEGRAMLRRLLFEEENTVFDIDRVFGLISGFLDTVSARTIGGAEPVATIALRDPERWRLEALLTGELDGERGEELLAVYVSVDDERVRAFDVLIASR